MGGLKTLNVKGNISFLSFKKVYTLHFGKVGESRQGVGTSYMLYYMLENDRVAQMALFSAVRCFDDLKTQNII
jgi:hypothetical protein